MQMESLVTGVSSRFKVKPAAEESSSKRIQESSKPKKPEKSEKPEKTEDVASLEITPITNQIQEISDEKEEDSQFPPILEKDPAQSSIDAAVTQLNAQLTKIHCDYSYDEDTKRISFKVFDDETDKLIREVPPEKSLEALKKLWEIAGIIIDEKR